MFFAHFAWVINFFKISLALLKDIYYLEGVKAIDPPEDRAGR